MKKTFTLSEMLDQLSLETRRNSRESLKYPSCIQPKKETISMILSYAKSVRCYKTKSMDRVLFQMN